MPGTGVLIDDRRSFSSHSESAVGPMRVFMLGWEFPPFISGGLGTACYGLTKAMSGIGMDVMFVLPRPVASPFSTHVKLVSPREGSPLAQASTEFRMDEFERVTFRTVNAALNPYHTAAEFIEETEAQRIAQEMAVGGAGSAEGAPVPASNASVNYGGDLFAE